MTLRKTVLSTFRKHIGWTVLLAAAIAGTIVLGLLPPLVLRDLVDGLTAGNAEILYLAGLWFALTAAGGIAEALQQSLITVFGQKITHSVRTEMADKLKRLPASYFAEHDAGSLTSRFVNDVDTIEALFDDGIISMIVDACKVVSIFAVVWWMSRGLGVLLLIALPLLFRMTRVFQKRMLEAQKRNREAVGRVTEQIPETIHTIRTIHVFHSEPFMEKRYSRSVRDSFDAMEESNFYDAVYSPIVITVSAVVVAAMMILSVSGDAAAEFFSMTAGSCVALIAYVGRIFDPLASIGMEIQNIQSAAAGISRVREFLAEPERETAEQEIDLKNEEEKTEKKSAEKETDVPLEVCDAAFGYGSGPDLFRGFTLRVDEGEHVTVAGRTGVGKSTLFKLILGLYKPREGSVRIFGRRPDLIPDAERRGTLACVEQQFHAVSGSVRDQITLGDPRITDEMVENALSITGLADTVARLEHGLDTVYSGALLSQGQRQLLLIARAVAYNPRILLMDEVTANLDSISEAQVLAALQNASEDRTVVSISHRLYDHAGGRAVEMK